jgi:hypothetical protein
MFNYNHLVFLNSNIINTHMNLILTFQGLVDSSIIMKTVLVFFVAFILILATLQANVEGLAVKGEHSVKAKRHLLNEATLGRKVSSGTKTDGKTDNDVDEVNPAYQSYSATSTETHHYYMDDQKPNQH